MVVFGIRNCQSIELDVKMNQLYFIIFVIAVAIPQAVLALETTPGILLKKYSRKINPVSSIRASDDNPLYCPADIMGPVCSSDCRTILTCIAGNLISSSKCADASSAYPYCVPNTFGCTDAPDTSYETCLPREQPPEFTCTAEGYFPNPHDCTEYFFCTSESFYKYACPPNYVYDAMTNNCRYEYICSTVDCSESANRFVSHPGNPAFYAFCSYADNDMLVIMFRCDHFDTHIFNPENMQCEFRCPSEGWFGHETNPNSFYECYLSDGVLVHRIQSCPVNYIFDSNTRSCIAGTSSS